MKEGRKERAIIRKEGRYKEGRTSRKEDEGRKED
jgi:hypothetical protein